MAVRAHNDIYRLNALLYCISCTCSLIVWSPTIENVALHKPCTLSSNYNQDGFENSCGAAINGNTKNTYRSGNCIHSDIYDSSPRWTVDLGQIYLLDKILVYLRGDGVRTAGLYIQVDDNQVYYGDGNNNETIEVLLRNGSSEVKGRNIIIGRNGIPWEMEFYLLNLCEVQVWAVMCDQGYFPSGNECLQYGHCAQNESCNNSTGLCPSNCAPGYQQTPLCQTECDPHYYGDNCSEECSAGCDGRECSPQTGHCTISTCLPGYLSSLCNQTCDPYHYGPDCQQNCSAGCGGSGMCDIATGDCIASMCHPNYKQTAKCDQLLKTPDYTKVQENNYGLLSGCIVGVGMFIGISAIILAVVIWKRRKNESHENTTVARYNIQTITGKQARSNASPLSFSRVSHSQTEKSSSPSTLRGVSNPASHTERHTVREKAKHAKSGNGIKRQGANDDVVGVQGIRYQNITNAGIGQYEVLAMPCQTPDQDGQLYEEYMSPSQNTGDDDDYVVPDINSYI